ncbi:autoinducer binding domain-containing protein [Leisingera sp. XS_AS12]|uniref:autoinducer binding domain-containing protein n=1 Tax=Leisingera sp. XS_AS12 TaxID=3241294 RepID=UPI003513E070
MHSNVWRSQFAYATYPAAWREAYHRHSLSMLDSILMWGVANTGVCRWDDVARMYPSIPCFSLRLGALHGMNFGAVASTKSKHFKGGKCMLSIARPDRPFSQQELDQSYEILKQIVEVHDGRLGMSELDIQTIQQLADGLSQDEIASAMGTSREAIKKRVLRIRKRIGARNATHVVSIAHKHSLI